MLLRIHVATDPPTAATYKYRASWIVEEYYIREDRKITFGTFLYQRKRGGREAGEGFTSPGKSFLFIAFHFAPIFSTDD